MKLRLPKFVINALTNRAKKTPFDHLGDYMERYWVFNPKGFFSRWFTARVHVIKRGDADRHLHDHPWSYTTFILAGGYTEVTHHRDIVSACAWRRQEAAHAHLISSLPGNDITYNDEVRKWECRVYYGAGSVLRRKARSAHRLEVEDGTSATTLFMMSNYQNKWGFYTPEGKVYWRDYLSEEDVTKRATVIKEHYNEKNAA